MHNLATYEQLLREIAVSLYPETKNSLRESEHMGEQACIHDHVRLEHVRPGMDDLVNAIKEKLEGREAEAVKALEEAKFHFSFVNYEGWICTASREIAHLQERLDSFWVSGDIDKAREKLRLATRRIVEARQGPNHSPQAAALAKQAALAAKEGREAIHLVPPSEKLKTVFTVLKILGGFLVGAITTIVGLKALGWI